ncbi:MAG: hypothetical protein A2579_11005 [Lysobacterales bacterium RIFOXYD1_FULL_69_11]|nr:MAG: hypothetical protein A2190_03485 [Xanthomonadales bacterium RIFOXYA1_FULL_69_10]OHE88726.1 MAG: hypothetical protein A2579_11005 [Xanthomonadales bacterium RIFOXYD1_FULL_69_11]
MDANHADAIARAFLQPTPEREANRERQAREDWLEREKRKVAGVALVGMVIGAVIAHRLGHRFTEGVIWGGLAVAAMGWAWIGVRARRRRASGG